MRFVAVDVETANPDMASICQIGGVVYEGGVEVASFSSYIDPEDEFDEVNVSIHGITSQHVVGAPTFKAYNAELRRNFDGEVAVCHTHFDRVSLSQACERYGVEQPTWKWLDSAKMARRTWSEVSRRGYGLADLADRLSIVFQHHDALHDARTAGLILMAAMSDAGLDLEGCIARCASRHSPFERVRLEPADGPFAQEHIVFTGALAIPRAEAASLANSFGAAVEPGVTKKTTILVVGDQDIRLVGRDGISNKHRKAESLKRNGQLIRIIRETDFAALCDLDHL